MIDLIFAKSSDMPHKKGIELKHVLGMLNVLFDRVKRVQMLLRCSKGFRDVLEVTCRVSYGNNTSPVERRLSFRVRNDHRIAYKVHC